MLKWISKLLAATASWTIRYPRRIIILQLILAVLCGWYTAKCLVFTMDRNALVGDDKKYHQIFLKYKKEFPGQDDIVAVVESDDYERNRMFVEVLGSRLEQETNLFTDVFYKGDLKMMGNKALLFADKSILVGLEEELKNYAPFIQEFMPSTNLVQLYQYVNDRFMRAQNEDNEDNRNMVNTLPALERILNGAYNAISKPGVPMSPGLAALFGSGEQAENEQYITFDHGRMYVVNVHAVEESLYPAAVKRLRELVEDVKMQVPGVNVDITGEPVLEYDEMQQSQYDTTFSSIVSLILCFLLFCYGYRQFHRPVAAVFCLMLGLVFTMGWTTFAVGQLNLLTITFLPMLIGLGIDFGVHLVSRFEEELGKGNTPDEAIHISLVNTGMGVFTGGIATAGAFLAMALGSFQGVKEMGIISGGGLIICLLPMMTILPVLLLKGAQWLPQKNPSALQKSSWLRAKIEEFWLRIPWPLFIVTSLVTITCICFALPRIHFDYNLLNMQSRDLPAVKLEQRLINSATNSVLFAIVMAEDLDQAKQLQKKIERLPSVNNVQSMAKFMEDDVGDILERIGRIKKIVEPFNIPTPELKKVEVDKLDQQLLRLQGYVNFAISSVKDDPNETKLLSILQELNKTIVETRLCILRGDSEEIARKLGLYQYSFFNDIASTFNSLKNQDNSGPLRPEDLPKALVNRFVSKNGIYALEIFPKKDVWDRENQEEFVGELRSVYGDVTGSPVHIYEYTSLLKNSYIEAAWYSLGAILILLYLRFRRITYVLLAMVPVGVGMLWLAGCMVLCGVPFNPANIMALPMTIGVGVSGGIQILNRYLEEGRPIVLANSTGLAVIISALTTIAGFGSLMLGKHQGIQSLGFVMGIGTLMCMIAALTILPAIMILLNRRGWLKSEANH
ncbi:MAG: MMPL family transporter [Verrucomicrobia bacterium]|nr:MMPL family transporter [Verrucomicrobiota bacterium]